MHGYFTGICLEVVTGDCPCRNCPIPVAAAAGCDRSRSARRFYRRPKVLRALSQPAAAATVCACIFTAWLK
ncbi:hypothetical protein F2A38_08495 [Pseudomonas chlororaphis]|uniref:Uncharacterized protein n=1 Tax=Pseudomonas chlororaphis TaxID=587753 RepID=A0AB34C8R8_9PSED|nr:hypothetical protein F2A38_08495 [Pseudomonas chlororaphis]